MTAPLPIDAVLPDLLAALANGPNAVLAAPPGAGKTTRVPLAMLDAPWRGDGKIMMLEPRRIAARAAATRLAEQLGEKPGGSVGYRIRGESHPGTAIEVVTEGVLTRMLQSDPDLPGIAAVLFDEVHERSINTDLGLTLCLEVQTALRPDLRLVAMSATLDTGVFARLMGSDVPAPVIESEGRMFPVETRWLDRPWRARGAMRRGAFEAAAADLIRQGVDKGSGDVLVFLPGAGEIERVRGLLSDLKGVEILALYGALPFAQQRAVLSPGKGRRVILATAIAETSLTVPGVRTVVDAGRSRRPRVDAATGLSRLVTEPVSRAEAEQRRGRAGRLAPGLCLRMWTKGEEGGLPAQAPPEILAADLAPLALELAAWGAVPADLAFPDPPPDGAYRAAVSLLQELDALDDEGRLTPHGRDLVARPTHPRLAHMLALAGADRPLAALIAALVSDRDPMSGTGADLRTRLAALAGQYGTISRAAAQRIKAEATRLGGGKARPDNLEAAGRLAAMAWPDRIALRRPGDQPRYLLSGGRGAFLAPDDPLAGERLLVALDLEDGREARIRLAVPLSEADLREVHGDRIHWTETAEWSPRHRAVRARRQERLGAIALDDVHWTDVPVEMLGRALLDGVRERGLAALPWSKAAARLRARMAWARQADPDLPDWSDAGLLATLDDWLLPHLDGARRIEDLNLDLAAILTGTLDWSTQTALDRAAPAAFQTPLGVRAAIDYSGERPEIAVRVQELFGLDTHPSVGGGSIPLTVTLLSPAQQPVQTTGDLPGFWRTSYADVRKDMRAKYPRHPWPEAPWEAEPTRRAKPRAKS